MTLDSPQKPNEPHTAFWERAIILVDANAFFASIEQIDHPELQVLRTVGAVPA